MLTVIAPEIFLLSFTLISLMAGVFAWGRIDTRFIVMVVTILLATLLLITHMSLGHYTLMNDMFVSDRFTVFSKLLIVVASIIICLIAADWLRAEEGKPFEFLILVLFSVLGLMLLVSANDLLSLYVSIELSSLALYVMAAFNRDNSKSSEAGLKYFVLGALASGMLLYGISLVYGFTGTTSFSALADYFSQFNDEASGTGIAPAIIVGLVLIIIAFCFKVSAVPFHMWTPDVYEGAPTPVTAFFAVVPKLAILLFFTRMMLTAFADLVAQWQQIIIFASLASMLVGALGALMQTNIKRLLAYSSIGHVGFMLMALATGTTTGAQSILIYLALYIFMSAGAFGCVLILRHGNNPAESLSHYSGLAKQHPWIAFALATFLFSMAGIPPMAGFFGKMYVVLAAITHGLTWLAVAGLITSVIACYYYLKVIKMMYFDDTQHPLTCRATALPRVAIAVCAFITLAYITMPELLITHAQSAAEQLIP